ncbi:MAG: hypothetical protein VX589_01295 [Myxococcota bacterium]|nr:hypothetical protein [Myxococcota bacterium]
MNNVQRDSSNLLSEYRRQVKYTPVILLVAIVCVTMIAIVVPFTVVGQIGAGVLACLFFFGAKHAKKVDEMPDADLIDDMRRPRYGVYGCIGLGSLMMCIDANTSLIFPVGIIAFLIYLDTKRRARLDESPADVQGQL